MVGNVHPNAMLLNEDSLFENKTKKRQGNAHPDAMLLTESRLFGKQIGKAMLHPDTMFAKKWN